MNYSESKRMLKLSAMRRQITRERINRPETSYSYAIMLGTLLGSLLSAVVALA
jgi:hypothetical protein